MEKYRLDKIAHCDHGVGKALAAEYHSALDAVDRLVNLRTGRAHSAPTIRMCRPNQYDGLGAYSTMGAVSTAFDSGAQMAKAVGDDATHAAFAAGAHAAHEARRAIDHARDLMIALNDHFDDIRVAVEDGYARGGQEDAG